MFKSKNKNNQKEDIITQSDISHFKNATRIKNENETKKYLLLAGNNVSHAINLFFDQQSLPQKNGTLKNQEKSMQNISIINKEEKPKQLINFEKGSPKSYDLNNSKKFLEEVNKEKSSPIEDVYNLRNRILVKIKTPIIKKKGLYQDTEQVEEIKNEFSNLIYSSPIIEDQQNDDMSSILSILHPLVSEDFIILGKSENYAILYRNVKGNLQTFKTDFKRIIMVIEKKVGNYKMQLIQDNHVLVVLKLKLQKRNEDLTVRVDLFDLPVKNLRGEIFIVQDPYILESILSKMDGAKKAISNKDNEKNKRKQLEKNKEVFEAYRTHNKSFKKLVELGIIKLKEVLHYENCIERLEREDEKLNKKIKLEE